MIVGDESSDFAGRTVPKVATRSRQRTQRCLDESKENRAGIEGDKENRFSKGIAASGKDRQEGGIINSREFWLLPGDDAKASMTDFVQPLTIPLSLVPEAAGGRRDHRFAVCQVAGPRDADPVASTTTDKNSLSKKKTASTDWQTLLEVRASSRRL